ncbi:GPI mannosyltransferase 2-like isoform X2 [Corticium candelabrum]|uniref:GPI mannosyltransferase 2-like isoform X2 n=1 Tax=Corticium candelabrum TaxID=121492 RepID=UPI002E26C914|nr:GPI mannosyltransferase 2-like isoform X2 [Corticium candelabrum]
MESILYQLPKKAISTNRRWLFSRCFPDCVEYWKTFLLNLCLFVLTVVALYHVVYIVCGTKRVAMISSILFCVSPASVFMSVMYSEILFSFCTFVGLWLLLTGRLWLSSLCFALSSAARSNGIVNCGFIAYSCISRLWNQRQCLKNTILHILVCAIQCFITLLPFLAFQVYGYFQFCTRGSDRPWCYDYIPLMYSFIQKQYWNVGLFRYYELKQLPNFFLASPVVVLSTIYVVVYFKSALERQFNPDFHIRKKCYNGGVWSVTALPFVVHLAFLLLVGTTSMHVQVITRLICSSTPGFYWFAGHVMDLDGKEFTHSQLCRCLVGLYFVTFSVVGTLMHSTFYPWT